MAWLRFWSDTGLKTSSTSKLPIICCTSTKWEIQALVVSHFEHQAIYLHLIRARWRYARMQTCSRCLWASQSSMLCYSSLRTAALTTSNCTTYECAKICRCLRVSAYDKALVLLLKKSVQLSVQLANVFVLSFCFLWLSRAMACLYLSMGHS